MPEYVVLRSGEECPEMLRQVAKPLTIPFTDQDILDIKTLSEKYDGEAGCAGLAAPQIGISKQIIVFAALDTPELRKWRPDLLDTLPKTIWINPKYVGVEEEGYHEDYEGCFSVEGLAGMVKRYKTIRYTALSSDGESVEGEIRGYLGRIIQHEIDHLRGVLFTDVATDLIPMEEYRAMRRARA